MRRTLLGADQIEVAKAAAPLGTGPLREAVDPSLEDVTVRAARERLIRRFSERTDLADPAVMRPAWWT